MPLLSADGKKKFWEGLSLSAGGKNNSGKCCRSQQEQKKNLWEGHCTVLEGKQRVKPHGFSKKSVPFHCGNSKYFLGRNEFENPVYDISEKQSCWCIKKTRYYKSSNNSRKPYPPVWKHQCPKPSTILLASAWLLPLAHLVILSGGHRKPIPNGSSYHPS